MQGTQSGDTTATSVRVALVQFDYQPSAALAYPYMEEPALLDEGEQGITSLHLSVSGIEERIATLRRDVAKEHEAFVRRRVSHILEQLDHLSVDVVVFPEYSIPASCLAAVYESAGNCTVVAGSHTVTSDTVNICRMSNIN